MTDECQNARTRLEIVLPVPLPTWNRILAMHHWQRMKVRHLLHLFVSLSYVYGADWPTSTDFQGKQLSTALLRLEYLQLIRPNKSRKCDIAREKARLKPRRSSSKLMKRLR